MYCAPTGKCERSSMRMWCQDRFFCCCSVLGCPRKLFAFCFSVLWLPAEPFCFLQRNHAGLKKIGPKTKLHQACGGGPQNKQRRKGERSHCKGVRTRNVGDRSVVGSNAHICTRNILALFASSGKLHCCVPRWPVRRRRISLMTGGQGASPLRCPTYMAQRAQQNWPWKQCHHTCCLSKQQSGP